MDSPGLTDVLHFWFDELEPSDWFKKSEALDQIIRERFTSLHRQLSQDSSPVPSSANVLSQVIVLDQFSRNMFRDRPEAFAFDDKALRLAQLAVDNQWDKPMSCDERAFLYMPFMHSENARVHETALALFAQLEKKHYLEFEHKHKSIIDRFGRYPHRNQLLGRRSTAEELEFLKQPNSAF